MSDATRKAEIGPNSSTILSEQRVKAADYRSEWGRLW